MEWSRDLESGGGGFDSRLPEVRSGSLLCHFWDVLGSVWEWSGDIFRHVWESFGKNVRWGSGKEHVLNWPGVFVLSRGASESHF